MNSYAGEQISSCALREAGAPFDDIEPGVTVYLRSSDNVLFGVYKIILAKASPIFNDIFRLPEPTTQSSDDLHHGIPMIAMQEDAFTLSLVLRLLYPVDNPTFTSLSDIAAVLSVFDKFMINSFPDTISVALTSYIATHPILVYAFACKYNLPYISNLAAKATLLSQMPTEPPAELLDHHYQALLEYRETYVARIMICMKSWIEDRPDAFFLTRSVIADLKDEHCGHFCFIQGRYGRSYLVPRWWAEYHKDAFSAITLHPRGSSAVDSTLLDRYKQLCSECTHCGPWALSLLTARSKMMEEEIEITLRGIEGVIPLV
jgi:hypothetical protein